MKPFKTILLLALSWPALNAVAQQKGMQFFEGSWTDLLAEAKRSNKAIFIDVYTTWCGPCKLMAKNIFPLEEVGNKYNAHFINYKLDAEKGEGVEIAAKFNVSSYPTYLYLNAAGELVFRGGGYSGTAGPFINDADKALEFAKDPNTISKLQSMWKSGDRTASFLRNYVSKLALLEMDNTEPMQQYFSSLSEADKKDEEVLRFLAKNCKNAATPAFGWLVENMQTLRSLSPEVSSDGFVMPADASMNYNLQRSAMQALSNREYDKLITCIRYAERMPVTQEYLVKEFSRMKMQYFGATKQTDSLIKVTLDFVQPLEQLSVQEIRKRNDAQFNQWMEPYRTGKQDSTKEESFSKIREYYSRQYIMTAAMDLSGAASEIAENVNDKLLLKRALGWNEKAVALNPDEQNSQIVSVKLLAKLGQRSKARVKLQPLLKKAKESGHQQQTAEYQSLMKSLN